MLDTSQYYYPNEAAAPIVWDPVVFAYTFLISGADMIILASLAYITKRLTRAIPMLLVLGISFFATVLFGPLADLRSPHKAALIFSHPHIAPTAENPSISFLALQSTLWIVGMVLSVAFVLLYFSYHMRIKANGGGRLSMLYKLLSLGIRDEASYNRLQPILKTLAILNILPMTFWAIYPASLMVSQTWVFLWRNWATLVFAYYADTFVVATAISILVHFVMKAGRVDPEVINPLLKVHAAGSISVASITALQLAIWWFWFGYSPVNQSLSVVTPFMYLTIVLLSTSFLLSVVSMRFPVASIFVSLVAFSGTIVNKWNIVINGQLVPATGLGVLELHLPPNWLMLTMSPISLGVFIFLVLSSIFPLEVTKLGK